MRYELVVVYKNPFHLLNYRIGSAAHYRQGLGVDVLHRRRK